MIICKIGSVQETEKVEGANDKNTEDKERETIQRRGEGAFTRFITTVKHIKIWVEQELIH